MNSPTSANAVPPSVEAVVRLWHGEAAHRRRIHSLLAAMHDVADTDRAEANALWREIQVEWRALCRLVDSARASW